MKRLYLLQWLAKSENKAEGNYYLGTIAKIIDYLENKEQKKGTKKGR